MVLFHLDVSQPNLVRLLNSILVLLYRLEDGLSLAVLSSVQTRDLRILICRLICFGKSLGCKSYDTEI